MKAKDITLGGIMTALSVLVLYLTSILPFNTIALLTIASSFIPVIIIRSNIKTASFVYIASTILGLFITTPNIVIMYALFFGIYGLIKYIIEKLNKISLEIILKLLFFNISLIVSILIIKLFLGDVIINLPIWLLFIVGQVVFLIYDYALTMIITIYINKFHSKI